jgi:hypothetical protein
VCVCVCVCVCVQQRLTFLPCSDIKENTFYTGEQILYDIAAAPILPTIAPTYKRTHSIWRTKSTCDSTRACLSYHAPTPQARACFRSTYLHHRYTHYFSQNTYFSQNIYFSQNTYFSQPLLASSVLTKHLLLSLVLTKHLLYPCSGLQYTDFGIKYLGPKFYIYIHSILHLLA